RPSVCQAAPPGRHSRPARQPHSRQETRSLSSAGQANRRRRSFSIGPEPWKHSSRAPRVVVAEKIAESGIQTLRECCEVDLAVGVERSELLSRLADAEGLIVRSATQVDAEMIAAAPNLRV